jgi:hypothetical protein
MFILPSSLCGKMLKALLIIVFLLPGALVQSRESSPDHAVYPTFGVGIGFFYPRDVNNYIESSLPSGYTTEYGFSELIMYLDVHAGITFRMKQFDISGMVEYDIAPKLIMVTNGDDINFFYNRLAPGITANYYIPVASGRHAFFIGGGVNYSFLKLEDFTASNPGFRLQAGFSLQFGKFNLQPFGAFNYVSATDSSDPDWEDFKMNYTSGQIGVNMSFHPRMNYK